MDDNGDDCDDDKEDGRRSRSIVEEKVDAGFDH